VHRYVFLLYEQPEVDLKEWALATGQSMGPFGRMRYELEAFEQRIGLRPAVAANYFCSN
jgi:hypothetical protein